jgi:Domain of unknown function (DUF4160)
MYFGDCPPPHAHVQYRDFEALVRLSDADVMRGKLPPTARRLVRRWIALHRDVLEANFKRVQRDRSLMRPPHAA